MRIVLDTNVLLQAIAPNSRLRPIWTAFLSEKFELQITSAILLEYEEIFTAKASGQAAKDIINLIGKASNVRFISVYYEWAAITSDYDDNKFFDAAVAANVNYLVTNDSHFNEAKKHSFPKVAIINAEEFLKIVQSF